MAFTDDYQLKKDEIATIVASANGYLAQLQTIANNSIIEGSTTLPEAYDYASVPQINFTEQGTDFTPVIDVVSASPPDAPTYDFSTIESPAPPDFNTEAPVLDFPAAPSPALPIAPGAAPSFVSPDIPAAPSVSPPPLPTFEALALPTAPAVNLPAFTSGLPTDDLTAPTAQFEFYEVAYESALLDPLKAKLLDNLANGGYGIETADEIALFNRARDREVEAMLSRIEDAGRAMAARGFPLPPGELSLYVDDAYQQMQNKVSSASRDITLERSKLFVDNRQFTIREVRELEQVTMNYWNSVQERALNVARLTVDMSVIVFKALVERYTARLNAYRAESEVFANRIRGELAKVEIYRTEVEAQSVAATMQRVLVDRYLAQLKGIEISVDIFKVNMEAAKVHADIERIKLEAFRLQVDTYTAQVQAKVAEFGMFRAQVEGETARVQAFEAQVRAYGERVTVTKLKSDVQLGKLQSEAEQARIKLATYQGQLEQYKADVERQVQSGRLQVDYYNANVGEARMLQDGRVAKANLQQESVKSTTQQNIDISRMTIENARARILGVIESLRFKTTAAQFGSEKFFSLLTALESSVNTLSVYSETA